MIRPLKIFGPSCRRHNKAHTVVQAGGQADRGERGEAAGAIRAGQTNSMR
jgi:hypothetical protein